MSNEMVPRDVAETWKAKAETLSRVRKEQAARIAELEAENARLKEALQKIADIDRYWRTTSRQSLATGDTHYDDVLEIGRFGKIASAALKETIHD